MPELNSEDLLLSEFSSQPSDPESEADNSEQTAACQYIRASSILSNHKLCATLTLVSTSGVHSPQLSMRLSHIVLLLGLTLLLYFPTLRYEFVYDDYIAIVNNPHVTGEAGSWWEVFRTKYAPGSLYRPITTLSYRVNAAVFGLSAAAFHAVNTALHCIAVLLIYLLLLPVLGRAVLAMSAALLFALHPLNIEAVANTVGRAELLTLLFGAGAAWSFNQGIRNSDTRRSYTMFACSAFLYFCACLSKETGYTFLGLIPLYVLATRTQIRLPKLCIRSAMVLVPVVLLALGLRYLVLGDRLALNPSPDYYVPANPLFGEPFTNRLLPALQILGRYLALSILPYPLSSDYSLPAEEFWSSVYSPASMSYLIVLAAFVCALLLSRKRNTTTMGVWFFVAFGLTSNLLLPIGTIMGERLAYIPLVGFLGYIVAEAAYEFDRRQVAQRVQLYVLVAVCLVFTLTSSMRMSVWQSNHALFSQTVRDAPQSPVAAFNYGLHLYKDKQDISRAQTYFRRSYELFPNSTLPIRMLVATSLKQREFGRAEFWLRKLLTLDPKDQGAATQLDKLLQLKSRAQKLGDDVRYSFDAGQ